MASNTDSPEPADVKRLSTIIASGAVVLGLVLVLACGGGLMWLGAHSDELVQETEEEIIERVTREAKREMRQARKAKRKAKRKARRKAARAHKAGKRTKKGKRAKRKGR